MFWNIFVNLPAPTYLPTYLPAPTYLPEPTYLPTRTYLPTYLERENNLEIFSSSTLEEKKKKEQDLSIAHIFHCKDIDCLYLRKHQSLPKPNLKAGNNTSRYGELHLN